MRIDDFNSKEQVLNIVNQTTSKKNFIELVNNKVNGSGWRLLKALEKKFDLDFSLLYPTRLTREQYYNNPNYCQYCGKELQFEQRENKFCSKSCSVTFNNFRRSKKEEKNKEKKLLREKEQDAKRLDLINRFESGENFLRGGGQIPTFIRKYFIDKYNCRCQKCGWGEVNPITNKVPLALHHINGDCTDNTINNLQLLCPNCHSLTDNFGVLNKNSKRFHRKKLTTKDLKNNPSLF